MHGNKSAHDSAKSGGRSDSRFRLLLGDAVDAAAADQDVAGRHLGDAAALCEHKLGTLLALEREPAEKGFIERFRVIEPERAKDHAKIWEVVPDDSTTE